MDGKQYLGRNYDASYHTCRREAAGQIRQNISHGSKANG